jgi:hypothetical protein
MPSFSVPIPAAHPAAYNGHYKCSMYKLLVVISLRGFCWFVDGPFGGTTYDDQLMRSSRPPDRHDLRKCTYQAEREKEILSSERRSFLRSRVEHGFGNSGLRVWRRFRDWVTLRPDWLRHASIIAFSVYNAEILNRHGTVGRYKLHLPKAAPAKSALPRKSAAKKAAVAAPREQVTLKRANAAREHFASVADRIEKRIQKRK